MSPNGGQSPEIAATRPNEASPNGRIGNASDAGKLDSTGDAGLVRRVPGAQMPAGARAARPGLSASAPADPVEPDVLEPATSGQDVAEQDAIAARSLVEEFEAGVQRALQLGDDRGAAGTAIRDEDGVR
jgi:hypothetical protein